jgi:transposase
MSRYAPPIVLSPDEVVTLGEWSRSRTLPARVVERAQIVRLAAAGVPSQEIAQWLDLSRPTVQLWRERFLALRLPGLEQDAPRPGRLPRISEAKIRAVVEATLHTTPPAAIHWSTRTMAAAQGVSEATIRRIWHQHRLQPHRTKPFKLSRAKQVVEKWCDAVGLYLNPPDKALVLGVDEKSQIQARDRTQPGLPLKRGRCGTMPHDSKRHGTTTLFAALSLLDGTVIGDCMPRHRRQEFIRFLKRIEAATPPTLDLHLTVDNSGTPKHPQVHCWLHRHPRFHLHFTPHVQFPAEPCGAVVPERADRAPASRLLRQHGRPHRGDPGNLEYRNQNPQVFVWSAPVERILAKIAKCTRCVGRTTLAD